MMLTLRNFSTRFGSLEEYCLYYYSSEAIAESRITFLLSCFEIPRYDSG
jgi:hypothetical protein